MRQQTYRLCFTFVYNQIFSNFVKKKKNEYHIMKQNEMIYLLVDEIN
jgi:hypothetical protein